MTAARTDSYARGQAIVELCVAMVVILMLLGALLTAVRMGRAHTRCAWEARANAGDAAVSDSILTEAILPHLPADPTPISDLARWDELVLSGYSNPLEGGRLSMYAMIHDREREEVDFSDVPFVGNFILGRDRVEVQADVYTVWTRGIY